MSKHLPHINNSAERRSAWEQKIEDIERTYQILETYDTYTYHM